MDKYLTIYRKNKQSIHDVKSYGIIVVHKVKFAQSEYSLKIYVKTYIFSKQKSRPKVEFYNIFTLTKKVENSKKFSKFKIHLQKIQISNLKHSKFKLRKLKIQKHLKKFTEQNFGVERF